MTIFRRLVNITVLASLIVLSATDLSNSQEGAADKNASVIKAVVIGTLHFQEGRGYFISVKSSENSGWENRVWLWISEDKVLVRRLQGLMEREVIAKGELEQMPETVHASVPPHGMYLKKIEIEGAPANKL